MSTYCILSLPEKAKLKAEILTRLYCKNFYISRYEKTAIKEAKAAVVFLEPIAECILEESGCYHTNKEDENA